MRLLTALISVFLICLPLVACQTAREVSFAYRDATYAGDRYKESDETSVLFLVDGLSSETLRTSLRISNCPNIANAFSLSTNGRFPLGRAVFPSLTFPNITSILTGTSDAFHPVTGNRVLIDGGVTNFENPSNWNDLARLIHRRTIFTRLAARDLSSVSLSYSFSTGATVAQEKSVDAGVGYLESDYGSIDQATLASLKSLLTETQTSKWPRFIFVHLIGVDALSHKFGPSDPRVQVYFHQLDFQLADIFDRLNHPNGLSASARAVNYAMTADHGFRATPDHSPLDEVVSRLNKKIRLIADNRVAPLFIDEPMDRDQKVELAKGLLQVPHVGWAAVKSPDAIDLFQRSGAHARISFADSQDGLKCADGRRPAYFEWLSESTDDSSEHAMREPRVYTCPSLFDLATGPDDDSFFIPALIDYFAPPTSPDAVFVPDDHSDFAIGYAGNHGGFTREEMLVPVLTKDVEMPRGVQPTSDLLRAMGVEP